MPGPIEQHLAALDAALHGPARAKARMLAEAHGGLTDAAAALAASAALANAEEAAVRDFGSVAEVAPAFQQELTVLQARRTALAVAVTVPALMLCWHLVTQGQHLARAAEVLAVHLGGLIAVTALLAAAATAATGALARHLPTPRRLPLVIAWTGTVASAALAATALTLTTASVVAGNWPLSLLTGALTIAAHTRIAASARACRTCARPAPSP